jgi:hypothetical protein
MVENTYDFGKRRGLGETVNKRFVAFEVLSGCYEEFYLLGYNAP